MTAVSVAELAEALDARFEGDGAARIAAPVHPSRAAEPGALVIATAPAYAQKLPGSGARLAVLAEGTQMAGLGLDAAIFVGRPRYALAGVTAAFAPPVSVEPGVHPTAFVETGAMLGEDVAIGPFCHVGARAEIGAGTRLLGHVTVGADARIGAGSLIHAGVRIGERCTIGERAILHPNAVIGSDGFSFVTPDLGAVEAAKAGGSGTSEVSNTALARIHSLAAVTLGDDVEVGANTAIDRGTLQDTAIGSGTKIDNLVQVGHNVGIGETCMICGQVGIAGSARIGDRVVLGGQSGVADHATIGSDVLLAAASTISGRVPDRSIVMGNPGVKRDEAIRTHMALRRLPRLAEQVAALAKRMRDET